MCSKLRSCSLCCTDHRRRIVGPQRPNCTSTTNFNNWFCVLSTIRLMSRSVLTDMIGSSAYSRSPSFWAWLGGIPRPLPRYPRYPPNRIHSSWLYFSTVPAAWIQELGITKENYGNLAHLALGLKKISGNHDPAGMVKEIDVFYAKAEEWFEKPACKWQNFVQGAVRFVEILDTHRTLINPPLWKGLRRFLRRPFVGARRVRWFRSQFSSLSSFRRLSHKQKVPDPSRWF